MCTGSGNDATIPSPALVHSRAPYGPDPIDHSCQGAVRFFKNEFPENRENDIFLVSTFLFTFLKVGKRLKGYLGAETLMKLITVGKMKGMLFMDHFFLAQISSK